MMQHRPRGVWGRILHSRRTVAGAMILLFLAVCVLALPPFLQLDPLAIDRAAGFWAAPSPQHWLGTDDVGRDVLARFLYGGRASLLVGFASAALSVGIGLPLGLVAGYRRGAWEFWIMRAADVVQCVPSILLMLCLAAVLKPSVWNLVLVIGGVGWVPIARLIYGNTLSVREKEFVLAARALGANTTTILRRNILPNVIAPVWAVLGQRVGRGILSEASLSFLGVGVRTPAPSWGNLLQYAMNLFVLAERPQVWLPPGIAIVLTVLALQLLGDGLRDACDPRHVEK